MSKLPNPGTIRVTFDTYTDAEAATILTPINRIFVGDLCYVRDATGTALTTRGGAKWSPQGRATLAHWGALGSPNAPITGVGNAGQLSEPTGEDQSKIAAALLWCSQQGRRLYGDPDRVYGVTGPLYIGAVTPAVRTWGIYDINLYVKSWSAWVMPRAGDDPDAWAQDAAVLLVGASPTNPLRFFEMRGIHIDCARLAGTGVRYLHATQINVEDVTVDRARTFGHDIGRPKYGAVTTVSCTASRFTRLRSREFWFSPDPSDGYTDWTVRTSCGIRVSGSDCSVAESEFSTAAVCGALGQGFNVAFDNCLWWGNPNGVSEPDYPSRVVTLVSRYACNYRFNNCSYQDGRVVVHGAAVPVGGGTTTPAFQGQFVGCTLAQYTGPQIVFVAHDVNETASSLIFIGNRVRSNAAAVLNVSGTGSWGDFLGEWVGNTITGGTSLTVQGKILIQGYFTVYQDGRVRAASLTPTTSTPGMNAMWCVGADGTLYTYGSGNWRAHTGTIVT